MTAILRLIRRYRARGKHRRVEFAETVWIVTPAADPWAPHPLYDPLTPTGYEGWA